VFLSQAENSFRNTDNGGWIVNLILDCWISFVLVVIVCRS
jgi:hypothetical protein